MSRCSSEICLSCHPLSSKPIFLCFLGGDFFAPTKKITTFSTNSYQKCRLVDLPRLYTRHSTPAAPLPGCLKGVEEHSTLGRIIACHLTKMVLLLYMLPHPHQSIAYYYHARLLSCDENHAYFLTKKSLDSSSPLYLH